MGLMTYHKEVVVEGEDLKGKAYGSAAFVESSVGEISSSSSSNGRSGSGSSGSINQGRRLHLSS